MSPPVAWLNVGSWKIFESAKLWRLKLPNILAVCILNILNRKSQRSLLLFGVFGVLCLLVPGFSRAYLILTWCGDKQFIGSFLVVVSSYGLHTTSTLHGWRYAVILLLGLHAKDAVSSWNLCLCLYWPWRAIPRDWWIDSNPQWCTMGCRWKMTNCGYQPVVQLQVDGNLAFTWFTAKMVVLCCFMLVYRFE